MSEKGKGRGKEMGEVERKEGREEEKREWEGRGHRLCTAAFRGVCGADCSGPTIAGAALYPVSCRVY